MVASKSGDTKSKRRRRPRPRSRGADRAGSSADFLEGELEGGSLSGVQVGRRPSSRGERRCLKSICWTQDLHDARSDGPEKTTRIDVGMDWAARWRVDASDSHTRGEPRGVRGRAMISTRYRRDGDVDAAYRALTSMPIRAPRGSPPLRPRLSSDRRSPPSSACNEQSGLPKCQRPAKAHATKPERHPLNPRRYCRLLLADHHPIPSPTPQPPVLASTSPSQPTFTPPSCITILCPQPAGFLRREQHASQLPLFRLRHA